jgi:hypothetical protein
MHNQEGVELVGMLIGRVGMGKAEASDSMAAVSQLVAPAMSNRIAIFVPLALCGALLCGCSKTAEQTVGTSTKTQSEVLPPSIPIDLATPDKALKSYWAVSDAVSTALGSLYGQIAGKAAALQEPLKLVASGAYLSDRPGSNTRDTFSRDIVDVKVETESRAVIIAVIKNTSPIPAGAEPTKLDQEMRAEGERYRYVLEKTQEGWRVAEVWSWSTYPKPDWKKVKPDDGKPSVPAFTFGGV